MLSAISWVTLRQDKLASYIDSSLAQQSNRSCVLFSVLELAQEGEKEHLQHPLLLWLFHLTLRYYWHTEVKVLANCWIMLVSLAFFIFVSFTHFFARPRPVRWLVSHGQETAWTGCRVFKKFSRTGASFFIAQGAESGILKLLGVLLKAMSAKRCRMRDISPSYCTDSLQLEHLMFEKTII